LQFVVSFSEVGLLFSCLKFSVAPLGPPGARGHSSLNRLNPRFLRHYSALQAYMLIDIYSCHNPAISSDDNI